MRLSRFLIGSYFIQSFHQFYHPDPIFKHILHCLLITSQSIHNRGGGKGLEISVDYKLISGDPYYLQKVARKLSKKESTKDINLSRIINYFECSMSKTNLIWLFSANKNLF